MTITIKEKTVYGRSLWYPVCDKAKAICELIGQKTIPDNQLQVIEKLGFQIVKE